jgi:hypothetical protein
VAEAEEILSGRWETLGVVRNDLIDPDWFYDPVTGRRAPQETYCFRIDHRSEAVTGNIKQVWELSRMQHATVLAAAYALTGCERFAERTAEHLRSWWRNNPFLSGVHWTSGIEIGVRLIAWVWIRRLLEGWTGVVDLFEENDQAVDQVWWHQRYLAAFRSRCSSANNHVIAEAAGQLIAALAFDWFEESSRWASDAALLLERELEHNTFPSGLNREMAFEYHGFVAELGLLAAAEADLVGRPLPAPTWALLCRMVDGVAATLDGAGRAPRQGDGDDGRGIVLGPRSANRWNGLLAIGGQIFGSPDWWPGWEPDATSTLLGSMAPGHAHTGPRPERRPAHFPDAGLTLLRTHAADLPEIWCRCDSGPHGFLSIAGHAHADALSLEVRHAGIDILADPGTYCYHGEAVWRSYFRSTLGHNTIEIGGVDQSASGGAFLWIRHARTTLRDLVFADDGEVVSWEAEHDGYSALQHPAYHQRRVSLDEHERSVRITDIIRTTGSNPVRLALHFGPDVSVALTGASASLTWKTPSGTYEATLDLPSDLGWTSSRGRTGPVLGWYSAEFGKKEPATTIVGSGTCVQDSTFQSLLRFHD